MALLKVRFPLRRRVRLAQGLWLMSWLAVACGGFTFALGVYLKTELLRRGEVMDNTEIHAVPDLLMAAGLAAVGANLLAGRICRDSLDSARFPRWRAWLPPWYGAAILIGALLLVAVTLSYALRGRLEESLKVGLRNGIRFYRDTDVPGRCFQKETMDRLQMELRCCGNSNHRDWFEVQWVSNRYLDFTSKDVKDRIRSNVDGRFLVDGVPFSCCNPASPRPCIQTQLTQGHAHFSYEPGSEELNLHGRGCRQALLDYYTGLMNTIGPGVLSVISLQMSVLVSLRYLQTAVEGAAGLEDPEGESEGFVLRNSVRETLQELHSAAKKLLKLGQVQATTEGAEPAAENAEKAAAPSS